MYSDSAFRKGSVLLDYLPKLIRLAEKNMSTRLQRKIGADDVANSVLKSMIQMINENKLPVAVEESEDFWRFLVVVSLNKIRKKARHFQTLKRNPSREVSLDDLEYMVVQKGEPSDEEGEMVAKILEKLEEELDDDGRIILAGRMEGLPNEKIRMKLNGGKGRVGKTVSRRWKLIEERAREIVAEMDLL